MIFSYDSPIGLMKIYSDAAKRRYALSINGDVYGYFNTVIAAGDAVYMHSTSCREWDDLDGKVHSPTGLVEWERER